MCSQELMGRRLQFLLFLFFSTALFVEPMQNISAGESTEPQLEDSQQETGNNEAEKESSRRERVFWVGLLLLAGIFSLGLILLAMVMLLGIRARRLARAALPRQSRGDPFWYLRPPKNQPAEETSDSSPDAPESETS